MTTQTIQQVDKLIIPEGKKVYFASDFHLGLYPYEKSALREKEIVAWLDSIKHDVGALFLVGDIFDFWYEYKKVVARGFTRFLGKICELTDSSIPVYFFTGNHDVWVFDYLPTETGMKVFRNPIEIEINTKRFIIGHGDGIGPNDNSYKVLRTIFHNKFLQFCFSQLHPNLAYLLGHSWSKHSRYSKGISDSFHGVDKEFNILFAKGVLELKHIDFFIFGHRHVPMDIQLNNRSKLINLGEWIYAQTYAIFDGNEMKLLSNRAKDDQDKIEFIRIN